MKQNIFLFIFLVIALFILPLANLIYAEKAKPGPLEGIEILTGFGWCNLHGQKHYHLTPLLFDFDFDLKPLIQKLNLRPRVLWQFQVEPFIAFVSSPDHKLETGTSFFFKAGFLPQTSKFQPYIKVGLGMAYITLHTREQSMHFNFTEQGCFGLHYFFKKNTAFTLEGRFRHLSNSGIKYPNHGINTIFVVGGILYQF